MLQQVEEASIRRGCSKGFLSTICSATTQGEEPTEKLAKQEAVNKEAEEKARSEYEQKVIESTLKKNKETHTPDATSKTKLEDAIPSEAQEHVANTVVHDELAESTPDSDVIYKKMENNTVNVTYTASTTKDPAPFSNGNGTRNEQVDMTGGVVSDLLKESNDLKLRNNRVKSRSIFIVLILLLSLAVNGLFAWKHIDASKKGVSYTEKVINGTTYQVLIYNVEVKEGQKKIFIYGFTVVNEDGKLTNVAVLFGEFDINEGVRH